jgi:hypothetical protein
MKSALKIGIVIGLSCAIWQCVMVAAGWLTNPSLFPLFYLVVLIEVAVLVWGLKQTAGQQTYGGQLMTGTGASLIAGGFLFAFSLLLTVVLFPSIMGEMRTMQAQLLRDAGRTEAEVSAALALQTPLIQAGQGLIGTVVTGVLATLVIAIFLRRKA